MNELKKGWCLEHIDMDADTLFLHLQHLQRQYHDHDGCYIMLNPSILKKNKQKISTMFDLLSSQSIELFIEHSKTVSIKMLIRNPTSVVEHPVAVSLKGVYKQVCDHCQIHETSLDIIFSVMEQSKTFLCDIMNPRRKKPTKREDEKLLVDHHWILEHMCNYVLQRLLLLSIHMDRLVRSVYQGDDTSSSLPTKQKLDQESFARIRMWSIEQKKKS